VGYYLENFVNASTNYMCKRVLQDNFLMRESHRSQSEQCIVPAGFYSVGCVGVGLGRVPGLVGG